MARRVYNATQSLAVILYTQDPVTKSFSFYTQKDSVVTRGIVKQYTPISTAISELCATLGAVTEKYEYEGVLAVSSWNKNGTTGAESLSPNEFFSFEYVILCRLPWKGTSSNSSSSTSENFWSFEKVVTTLADDYIVKQVLAPWYTSSPLARPPVYLPDEKEHSWKSKNSLDLVVFVVIMQDSNVLMVKEKKQQDKLFLPAGHFESGESIVDCCKREVKEEAGFDVAIKDVSSIRYGHGWSGKYSPLHFVVTATIVGGQLKTVPDKESNGAVWMPLATVLEEIKTDKEKYRNPWEIGPILQMFDTHLKSGLFIKYYNKPTQ